MLGRAALHPSVTRRAASYESHSPRVSIEPSEPKAAKPIPAHAKSFRGPNRAHGSDRELHRECRGRRCRGVHRGCADPGVELVFRRLHTGNAEESLASTSTRPESPVCPITFEGVRQRRVANGRRRQRLVETPPLGFQLRPCGRNWQVRVGQSGHSLRGLSVGNRLRTLSPRNRA